MLEKIQGQDIIVRNYTDNFSVKEYITQVLMPLAFPNIPVGKLNAGFTGVMNEYVSQLVEDSYATASLMLNENFITKAVLPNSIYAEAGLFDLGYTFASPSRCQFALQIWIDDILERGQPVGNRLQIENGINMKDTGQYEFVLDRDTKIVLGDYTYRLDYDVVIRWRRRSIKDREIIPFSAQYDVPTPDMIRRGEGFINSVALTNSRWIKCRVTRKGWLVLLVTLQQFNRKVTEEAITDNLRTTNSDIPVKWADQIAGMDLVYINSLGERVPMKKKIEYSDWEIFPFAYYSFYDDHTINLGFSPAVGSWKPGFNDKIETTVYTTNGRSANFDVYDKDAPISVEKTGERYEYNADTHIVAVCYSGSSLGADKKDIEMLRSDVKTAYNTVKVLSTDHDLEEWFQNFAMRHDTKATFFKRRDDPTGRLFSQFVAITEGDQVYPTNTLTIEMDEDAGDFDYVSAGSNEFIIKPGHVWEYKVDEDDEGNRELSRTTVVMTKRSDGTPAMVSDNPLPRIDSVHRPFMFVNPFLIKIHRSPQITACYNYLINNTSHLEEDHINQDSEFRHFQLSLMNIERTLIQRSQKLGNEHVDRYTVKVTVNPILPEEAVDEEYRYVRGTVDDPNYADYWKNNLRLVLVFKHKLYGETGYMEMFPISIAEDGLIEFEGEFAVKDNLTNEGYLIVDPDKTANVLMNDSINYLPDEKRPEIYKDLIIIDSEETQFKMVALLKIDQYVDDFLGSIPLNPPYDDPRFGPPTSTERGWQVVNVFTNDYRELTLYKPMTMMRSTTVFGRSPGSYLIRANLMPFVGYRLAIENDRMAMFVRKFNEQYAAVEPVIFERLDNNCHLDLKLYNTYGRSNNYYIGDDDEGWELLDDVSVKIAFQLSVKDRMSWTPTAEAVMEEIKEFFSELCSDRNPNVYISNLIRRIEEKHPNVDHLKFISIGEYDATKQYIRVKYEDVSDLGEDELSILVPEILICLAENIELIEES